MKKIKTKSLGIQMLLLSVLIILVDISSGCQSDQPITSSGNNVYTAAQYFGIFDHDNDWDSCVKNSPFDKTDFLYLAFVHTYKNADGKYIADYEYGTPNPSERIDDIVNKVGQLQNKPKILISLGYGHSDFPNATLTPVEFTQSVINLIEKHNLDGFDIDWEDYCRSDTGQISKDAVGLLLKTLRDSLNALGSRKGKSYFLTMSTAFSPVDYSPCWNSDAFNLFCNYLNLQSYSTNCYVVTWRDAGVNCNKILVGIESEWGQGPDVRWNEMTQYNCAGMFAWRLDNEYGNGCSTGNIAINMWNRLKNSHLIKK
jgi:GH18 family chitinase